ncbi:MAG: hypothetical protein KJ799_09900 [Bacteroidetes bacterium]|nr:hypothetical protein [Bacteroidota bacterium]MBU1677477.1 hypothetical protein [Bacteroidota bacterium]MBU2507023.1 hypothetical protein [Bacteroidota bacterium]
MVSLLDVIGATVISAFVILILINLNAQISISAGETLLTTVVQQQATATISDIEYHVYKAGHQTSGGVIVADSTRLKFYSDYDNDGVSETLEYYLGAKSELTDVKNPSAKPLHKKLNNSADAPIIGLVDTVMFSYIDSSGAILSYSKLTAESERNKIRSIKISLSLLSAMPMEGVYPSVDWDRLISPRNLNL